MPDRRTHRSPHPEDARLFAAPVWPTLCQAIDDLCWLLSRGYAVASALKLVGDRYGLVKRQRTAVGRSACSDEQAARRKARQVDGRQLGGRSLWIDGYNVLTTVEAALSGGVILPGRDGTYRDMASMHGSYRKLAETRPALERLGRVLGATGIRQNVWLLDRPVSNSGRLKGIIEEVAAAAGWPWEVRLVSDPDRVLIDASGATAALCGQASDPAATDVVATADSVVLDRCGLWFGLARQTVEAHVPDAVVVQICRQSTRNTVPDPP